MSDQKTERATPKRRDEARKKGQMARSIDLGAACVLVCGIATLAVTGPGMFDQLAAVMRRGLAQSGDAQLAQRDALPGLGSWAALAVLRIVAPVALAAVAGGVAANVLQNRPRLNAQPIKPQWSRVNPKGGLKRLFGLQAVFETVKSAVKMTVVGLAGFLAIWPRRAELSSLAGAPPGVMLGEAASTVLRLAMYVAAAFFMLALVDYVWQRYQYEKGLRMSKDEIKQESRQQDIPPEVRGAIRRRQFAQARKRMITDVATADVVVTNPTHVAVALRYDGTLPAPEVIAKGVDLMAAAIRSAAEEHEVPIISNPPLARALYREVDLGRQIPDSFFQDVAEVLAFVYRTARRRRRHRIAS